jgi:hypothetical protein
MLISPYIAFFISAMATAAVRSSLLSPCGIIFTHVFVVRSVLSIHQTSLEVDVSFIVLSSLHLCKFLYWNNLLFNTVKAIFLPPYKDRYPHDLHGSHALRYFGHCRLAANQLLDSCILMSLSLYSQDPIQSMENNQISRFSHEVDDRP